MNLAELSNALNVPHEFLTGHVFERGLVGPVGDIQAAAAASAHGTPGDDASGSSMGSRGHRFKKNSAPLCKKRYSSL